MSELGRLPPTRSALVLGQRRAARFVKGAQLLRRKREALVTELLRLARPASAARARIETMLACGRENRAGRRLDEGGVVRVKVADFLENGGCVDVAIE